MFVDAGFAADDVRIWFQPCNWLFEDGEDYWRSWCNSVPEGERDEVIRGEMVRLFEEGKNEMKVFEKCFILVKKE